MLDVFGSGFAEVTVAVLVIVLPPGASTCTTIVTVAVPLLGIDAKSARTVPLVPAGGTLAQGPALVVQERKVVCGGSGSLTWTVLAVFGPLLVTVMVYVSAFPVRTGLGEPVFARERSAGAGAVTLVEAVPLLLAGFGSVTEEDATAVLVSVEPAEAVTLTTIETRTVEPDGMVPRLKVTVPLVPTAGPVQLPAGAQETKVVPLGIESLTITPVAGSGPPLLTEML